MLSYKLYQLFYFVTVHLFHLITSNLLHQFFLNSSIYSPLFIFLLKFYLYCPMLRPGDFLFSFSTHTSFHTSQITFTGWYSYSMCTNIKSFSSICSSNFALKTLQNNKCLILNLLHLTCYLSFIHSYESMK